MYSAALSGIVSSAADRGSRLKNWKRWGRMGLTGEDPVGHLASTSMQVVHDETVFGHHHTLYPLDADVRCLAILVVFGHST